MEAKSLAEQEKEVKDLLRRAERTPVKTSTLRRDALRRLIDLAHSEHPALKILCANNLKLFIKDFPDLEDDAINAVYDICEDPVQQVRIKGYAAIVDVSKEQPKWIKRNVDVLVQLLQSEEPEEVTFVKRALTQHLDMDPTVTLGVICDQIVPSDEPLDEDEQIIRDRLRTLVLAFITGEAKRGIVERHTTAPGSPAEEVLVSGLLRSIGKLTPHDTNTIIKDLLLYLSSFKPSSPRVKELFHAILAAAESRVDSDLGEDRVRSSLQSARYYLGIASFLTVERKLYHPGHLLLWYSEHLTRIDILERQSEDGQAFVIAEVAKVIAVAEARNATWGPIGAPESALVQSQLPDVYASLLQVFADIRADQRPWAACKALLEGLAHRKADNQSTILQAVTPTLERIRLLADSELPTTTQAGTGKLGADAVQSLIRSLIEPPVKTIPTRPKGSAGSADQVTGNVGTGQSTPGRGERRIMNVSKRKLDAALGNANGDTTNGARGHGPAGLPPKPQVSSPSGSVPSGPRGDRIRGDKRKSSSPPIAQTAGPSGSAANGEHRSAKRARNGDGSSASSPVGPASAGSSGATSAGVGKQDAKPVPSLLSRLTAGALAPKAGASPTSSPGPDRDRRRNGRDRNRATPPEPSVPAKRRAEAEPAPTPVIAAPTPIAADAISPGGLSIKGAARNAGLPPRPASGAGIKPNGPVSLLDRMQPVQDDRDFGRGGGRKRGRFA